MPSSLPSAVAGRRRSSLFAASATLFGQTESPILNAFDGESDALMLRSGEALFRQGDRGDALFVVTHGSLEVLAEDPVAPPRTLAVIGRGGLVGEMALLVDEPRSATVRALRDSEVVRIGKEAFDALLLRQPALAIEIARGLVRRLRRTSAGAPSHRRPRTVSLVPASMEDLSAVTALATSLAAALDRVERSAGAAGGDGGAIAVSAEMIDRELGAGAARLGSGERGESRVVERLSELEDAHSFVLFRAESLDSPWTARCVRQADLVLVVARSRADTKRSVVERLLANVPPALARRELVLLHDHDVAWPSGAAAWLGAGGVSAHHHVRADRDDDVRRLARAIAGRSVGVVLSGGGARGFAHIGVLRAIQESGLPVDVIGGTSMGAIIAAQWAAGNDCDRMVELNRRHYVAEERGSSDRTVPVAAFSSGRGTVRKLKAMFGDRCVEDLWTRYFAVTASLTEARSRVHDAGPLWLWTRVSCAIPGLAPPVSIDGELLADGGILDNLPVSAMRERCAGKVIACDVSVPIDLRPPAGAATRPVLSGWPLLWERLKPGKSAPPSFPSIVEILERTALLGSVRDSQTSGRLADLYLRPPVDEFGMASFGAIDRLVEIGYRHALDQLDVWLALERTGGSGLPDAFGAA